jgi:hypothetical protein
MYTETTRELVDGKEVEVITLSEFAEGESLSGNNSFELIGKENATYTVKMKDKFYIVLSVTTNGVRVAGTNDNELISIKLLLTKKVKANEADNK